MSELPIKVVYYPATGKVFSREELREVFKKFSVHDEPIAALRQIFQVRFAQAALDSAQPKITDREAAHAGGRVQEISDFREEILGYLHAEDQENPAVPAAAGRQKAPPRRHG